jgi:glutamyl-tRNA reductase
MSGPILFLLGASHHTTPLELREKLALTEEKLPVLHERLRAVPGLGEYAVLNTCNRVEFYGVADSDGAVARVQEAFCRLNGFDEAEFARIRQALTGPGAVRHLLEVSSGLDSQMLGENEIFGQVKSAYAQAQARQTVGPVLNRLFQKAFHAAKHVRTQTAITEGQISVANVAVDLAVNIFGDLASAQVLLLGAGEIGEKTAKAFQSRGAGGLAVSSRTLARAMELASAFDAVALPFEHRTSHLHRFDIVVCSTAAPSTVVSHEEVVAAMKRRPARPLFLIDLAMPRDVDASVAGLTNVFLYNLDDLARIADENRAARAAKVAHARELVAARTEALWEQLARQFGAERRGSREEQGEGRAEMVEGGG